jgi:prepilin-type N-terminal cleavage/methylation domain-containing protein
MQTLLERHRRRREEGEADGGFTLIELLIVIVILGILAAIVVFAVQNLTSQSASSACASDYKTVEGATEVFKTEAGAYPGDPNGYPNFAKFTSASTSADAGINVLMGTGTGFGSTNPIQYGPWLKDDPHNPDHYQISVSNDGKGSVIVKNGAGTAVGTDGGISSADCSQIK